MLSKDMQNVLDEMRIYLMSSGKSDKEIEGIMNELTVHAWEGEKDGKTVRQIFGDSPKSYVQALSKELSSRPGEIAKLFFAILIGAISYFIFSDAVNDSLDYSVYTLAGYPLYILLAAMLPLLGRITAFKGKNTAFMYTMVYAALTFFPILAIIFIDRQFGTPVFSFDGGSRWLIMALSFLVIVCLSFRLKAGALSILPLLAGTHFLFQYMNWDSAGAMMAETYIPYIGSLLVMFIETKRARNTAQYE
nr:DUF1129 domain-containing protein [Bacillus licheniformis]